MLREKDLSFSEYKALALEVLDFCFAENVRLLLHGINDVSPDEIINFILEHNASSDEKFAGVHFSIEDFQKILDSKPNNIIQKNSLVNISDIMYGVSAHSLSDALFCEEHGATYITASHIFPTDCKKDLPPKGIPFLKEICDNTEIPVFALGGIKKENASDCISAGAFGVSVMSECMRWDSTVSPS